MFAPCHFQQLLQPLPQHLVQAVVDKYKADKFSKGFSCFNQLVVMVYSQLSGCSSLRNIALAFNNHRSHHYHLGCAAVRKSTLADANAKRDPMVFYDLVSYLISLSRRHIKKESLEMLRILDSTSLTLKGRDYDKWTLENKNRFTQGLKVHVEYDDDLQIPTDMVFSAPNVNDITVAVEKVLQKDRIYVFDKGYYDYNWWAKIDGEEAKFVTRFKSDAALIVQEYKAIDPAKRDSVIEDSLVRFKHKVPRGGKRNEYKGVLRRVVLAVEDGKKPLILATNDLESPAEKIGEYYKRRWQIELFFKWIKQHLKIKTFVGRSERAVKNQILCAMIAYLLLAQYKTACNFKDTTWHFMSLIGKALFQRPALEQRYIRRQEKRRMMLTLQPPLFT